MRRIPWYLPLCAGLSFAAGSPVLAHEGAESEGNTSSGEETANAHHHSDQEFWHRFCAHLQQSGQEKLLNDLSLPSGDELPARFDVEGAVRAVLFRLSSELILIDEMFSGAKRKGTSLNEVTRLSALIKKARSADDPYVRAYGDYFDARLSSQAGEAKEVLGKLSRAMDSEYFLPRGDAHRLMAKAYQKLGDPTLASLELQLFLAALPPERDVDRVWAKEELRRIRTRNDGLPPPLAETALEMRRIGDELSKTGTTVQVSHGQERVEGVLERVVKLLESSRCGNCGAKKCSACGGKTCDCSAGANAGQCPGGAACSGGGRKTAQGEGEGEGKAKTKGKGSGDPNSSKPSGPAGDTKLARGAAGEEYLEAAPEDKEAWGRINNRKVAASLRAVWDKLPVRYRVIVSEYFEDITGAEEPEAGKEKAQRSSEEQ